MTLISYTLAITKFLTNNKGVNVINNKVFEAVKGGVRIYYPDGVIRFISNSWEGEMFV